MGGRNGLAAYDYFGWHGMPFAVATAWKPLWTACMCQPDYITGAADARRRLQLYQSYLTNAKEAWQHTYDGALKQADSSFHAD